MGMAVEAWGPMTGCRTRGFGLHCQGIWGEGKGFNVSTSFLVDSRDFWRQITLCASYLVLFSCLRQFSEQC